MAITFSKYEFDLTVKKFGEKARDMYEDRPMDGKSKEVKMELMEKLEFKTLSAVEVIRKLLDYIS